MLFYTQIKREFSQISWKRGQVVFRQGRVRKVRLDGNMVEAQVEDDSDELCKTAIVMARGTIGSSDCSCGNHNKTESHCKHVAALSIWIVERGSLLRAGVGSVSDGVETSSLVKKESSDLARAQEPAIETVRAEPVLHVRGFFSASGFTGIAIEPAARFRNPNSAAGEDEEIEFIAKFSRQSQQGVWKHPSGFLIKLTHTVIPVLQTVDMPKMTYLSPEALDKLVMLTTHPEKKDIYFSENVRVRLSTDPLKLTGFHIGEKGEKSRSLSYEFSNKTKTLSSDVLAELSSQGRVSGNYVWDGDTIYTLEIPLASLGRYVSRSGVVAAIEKLGSTRFPEAILQLQDDDQHPLHPLAAYRLSLELGVSNFSVDVNWKEFHSWKKRFEKKNIPKLPNFDYGFSLRNYQQHGLSWLWSLYHRGLSALLADDMGLGKTHQVMAFLTTLYGGKSAKPILPTLVVAPTSVVAAWIQKLSKYDTHLKWHVFHGKGRVLPNKEVNLVLTTYGILQREAALREREWHTVVLDEAQAIKNPSTISSRVARVLKSEFRIAMTGTPVENQSTDLWSIMEFLLPGYLGSNARFKRLYGSGRDKPSKAQSEGLKRLVSPFLLRRTKSQVLTELPEKTEEIVHCEMTPQQKKIYNAYLQSADAARLKENIQTNSKIDYTGILALLTRLKQVCDHPRLSDLSSGKIKNAKRLIPLDSGKWEPFEEILNEALGSSLKVVVFTQYLGMIDLVSGFLKSQGIGFVELRGDTRDREGVLKKFSSDPECKVFLCSLLAGGLGIDLTSASVCIHLDRWWNPAKENQATDRLHRIGQTRGVQVFKLQIPGTIEDRIASIIESKVELSGALIEESPLGLKVFSRDELLSLFAEVQ